MPHRKNRLPCLRQLSSLFCFLWITLPSLLCNDPYVNAAGADPVRGVLVRPERVTSELLEAWKARGATSVVVPVDDALDRVQWAAMANRVEQAELLLYIWIEVARNPAMAEAHPEWMAAAGGHHQDWRRRFPKAPPTRKGEVVKAWPWVPIGYAPAFEAHRQRLRRVLDGLPGKWSGVFLNDLQAGPSSCGCGNDQCRWALDYGTPSTAPKTPGDDAAARLVSELQDAHPGKAFIPVWVTECETIDLADAEGSTGLCGTVPCAKGSCWPRYAASWNSLLKAANGPVAWAAWSETFERDPVKWVETGRALFENPPHGGLVLPAERTVTVLQGWSKPDNALIPLLERAKRVSGGWVLALDPIEQSWEPKAIALDREPAPGS